ncbi:MAG: AEC family transporter [Hyphomicrobiales bacterium]|jgi:malonate transporter|nr:AEC family transporter [Hyphomicrobiales bacterium]
MLALILIVLPVFVLIGVGYAARRSNLVSNRTGDGLSEFVFTLAVPCLLFRTLARAEIPAVQPWGYWISYFSGVVICWTLAMLIATRVFRRSGPASVACGFAAAQSNTVLVGIPIILKAFGEAGTVPLALLLAVHLPVTMTAATVLAEGRKTSARAIARKLLTHPIIIGILLGTAFRPFAAEAPALLWMVVDMLAETAVPCALVTLGIALCRYGLESGLKLPLILSALKLVLHPLIVFVLITTVFTMPPAWAGVAVMFAACPCGINAYLFAERYRDGMAEASTAIAMSTLFAMLTMVLWLGVLGIQT